MRTAGPRLQIRRGIDVTDAQTRQVGSDLGGLIEAKALVELQAIGCPRNCGASSCGRRAWGVVSHCVSTDPITPPRLSRSRFRWTSEPRMGQMRRRPRNRLPATERAWMGRGNRHGVLGADWPRAAAARSNLQL